MYRLLLLEKKLKKASLRWFGHVQRMDGEQRRKTTETVHECSDLQRVRMTKKDARNRMGWWQMTLRGTIQKKKKPL